MISQDELLEFFEDDLGVGTGQHAADLGARRLHLV